MGTCNDCIYWYHPQWLMDKYGEGCGKCMQDGQIRSCSHNCPFCTGDVDREAEHEAD